MATEADKKNAMRRIAEDAELLAPHHAQPCGYTFRIAKRGETFDIDATIARVNRAHVDRLIADLVLDPLMLYPAAPTPELIPFTVLEAILSGKASLEEWAALEPNWIHEWDVP